MLQTKLFEIRDLGTFIPAVATSLWVLLESADDPEAYLIRKAGFAPGNREVFLARLSDFTGSYDPHKWSDTRTMPVAHKYIRDHWDELQSGAVIDVEFIRGEKIYPAPSERHEPSIQTRMIMNNQNAVRMINEAMGIR